VEVLDMRKSKDVLNVEEAAELLGVSPWTVREQARQGHLPGRKVGKEWRFSRQGLMIWLQDGVKPDILAPPEATGHDTAANW
jgi:excisionase family DNA binding protein